MTGCTRPTGCSRPIQRLASIVSLATLLCLFALVPPLARADSRDVHVTIVGSPAEDLALRAVLAELMARLPVEVRYERASTFDPRQVVSPPQDPPSALARVWLDLRSGQAALVYLVDGPWERVLVRRVPMASDLDEITVERLGHIVHSSVEALLAGGQIGVTRDEAREQLGLDATVPPTSMGIGLGVGYTVSPWAADAIRHGPTVQISLRMGDATALCLSVAGTYLLPRNITGPSAVARVSTLRGRVWGGVRHGLGDTFAVTAEVGLGVDRLDIAPRVLTTTLEPEPVSQPLSLVAGLRSSFSIRLASGLFALVHAELEADLVGHSFFVDRGGLRQTHFEPWRLWPVLGLGLASDIEL